jgi:peptidoglycan/xylan/chitin deacetylase (PgdA/CDA1 family)
MSTTAGVPAEVASALTGSAPGWPLVLYFHHVHPDIDHYTSLTPESFTRGLETVLRTYGPALDPGASADLTALPDHPSVLVTFDDGHRDNLEYALPVLDRLGVKALFFCITGMADDPAEHDRAMSWPELAGLHADGHLVGAHSVTHRKLPDLGPDEQRTEVAGSLSAVTVRLGVAAPAFAYPYGLLPTVDALPAGTLAFGTVKAAARPWSDAPWDIRRTYLPVAQEQLWPDLCADWRRQWFRPSA